MRLFVWSERPRLRPPFVPVEERRPQTNANQRGGRVSPRAVSGSIVLCPAA